MFSSRHALSESLYANTAHARFVPHSAAQSDTLWVCKAATVLTAVSKKRGRKELLSL